jgi:hypothetical protein
MAFAHITQVCRSAHAHGHRGLAGAGVAGEALCRLGAWLVRLQVDAQLVDHQQRRDVADARFDRRQADQVAIELGQHFLHLRCGKHLCHAARAAVHQGVGGRVVLRGRSRGRRDDAGDGVAGCAHGGYRCWFIQAGGFTTGLGALLNQ